jgi:hypothetical protein
MLRRRHLAEERMERFLERVLAALLPDHRIRRHHHHRRLAPNVPYGVWDRLAMCETGGDWRWGSQFADPAYEGGIGFATSTWLAYRLPGYPLEAWRATRDEQIAVGRRVLAAVGPGAWGCAAVAGLQAGS